MFSNSFCSCEDQMMISTRIVFVDFWCKQELFGKGISVLIKTNRRLTICWLNYMVEPMESICLTHLCSWVHMGLPLVQRYLIQFERLVKKLVPQVGEHFEKRWSIRTCMQGNASSLFFHTPSLSHWRFGCGMSPLLRLSLVPHCFMPCFGRRL